MAENGKKENGKDSENRIVVFFKFLKKIVYNFFQEIYNFLKEGLKLLKEIILTTLSGILKILIKIIEVILRFLAGIITALACILAKLLEKLVGSIKELVKLSHSILATLILSFGGGSVVGLTVLQADNRELEERIVNIRSEIITTKNGIVDIKNEIAQRYSERKLLSGGDEQGWEKELQRLERTLETYDKESKKIECKLQEKLKKHNQASENWQKCVTDILHFSLKGCRYDKPGTYTCPDTQNSETKQAENTDSAP